MCVCMCPGYNNVFAPDQACYCDGVVMLNASHLCADVSEGLEQNPTVTVLQAQEYHAAPLCIQCVSCVYVGAVSVFG